MISSAWAFDGSNAGSIPETAQLHIIGAVAGAIVIGAYLMARWELAHDPQRNEYVLADAYRTFVLFGAAIGLTTLVSVSARAVGAQIAMVRWPWLAGTYWIWLEVSVAFFLGQRLAMRYGRHPLWHCRRRRARP